MHNRIINSEIDLNSFELNNALNEDLTCSASQQLCKARLNNYSPVILFYLQEQGQYCFDPVTQEYFDLFYPYQGSQYLGVGSCGSSN